MRSLKWLVLALWASSAAAQTYPSPVYQNVTDRSATLNQLVLGGGTGLPLTPLGSLGTTTTVLHGNAAGAPSFGAVVISTDVSGLGTGVATALGVAVNNTGGIASWPVAISTGISGLGTGVATALGVAVNNTGGIASWPVALTTGVSGILPVANGGTNCSVASGTCLDNITGFATTGIASRTGAGAYSFSTLTSLMDTALGSTQGSVLYRNATVWTALGPGTAGQLLQTGGAGANPSWTTAGTGTVTNVATGGALTGGPITTTGTISPTSGPANIRVTLTSATPVLTSAVTGATTVYCTPYGGNLIPVWNGSTFISTPFTEMSQATTDATKSPAAVAATQVYDLFVWNDAGTLRCTRGPTWASGTGGSNTARGTGAGGTALSLVNGLYVNAAAITNGPGAGAGTYVGTIASNGTSTIDWQPGGAGTAPILNVWNNFNRVKDTYTAADSTASWTYTTATVRQSNNSTVNQVNFVSGLPEDRFTITYYQGVTLTANAGSFIENGWGLDSTTVRTKSCAAQNTGTAAGQFTVSCTGTLAGQLGLHFIASMELGDGTHANTFFGNTFQGLTVDMRM